MNTKDSMKKLLIITTLALVCTSVAGSAQQVLSLEQCRQMAVEGNNALKQERVKQQMAEYDRKIATANYFPNISVKGAYFHNGDNISLVSDEQSAQLTNAGTIAQAGLSGKMQELTTMIQTNPQLAAEYMQSPMWQTVLGMLSTTDISTSLNALGTQIDDALHFNIENIGGGMATLQQPVFAGGKIVASNKIARLAEQLAASRYDQQYRETVVEVDNSYWQVVSIAAKKKLADNYLELLQKLLSDAEKAKKEGLATDADILSVKVKANEAAQLQTRSDNGLKLAKMLLCKQIGLPIESQIILQDEGTEEIEVPTLAAPKSIDDICGVRPELRQLELAKQIYQKKVSVARADMLPTIAITANYLYTNPNSKNGYSNTWGGTWNAGVVVNIPIFHATEALQKTKKAKAEASLYQLKYDDAVNMVNLQVSQLRCQWDEASKTLDIARANLESAEENLRKATLGFTEGVIPASTAMEAQTAWLSAHSSYVDAGIELRMIATNINKAEGNEL